MSLQTLVVGSVAWLALCAIALWWVLPRLAHSDKERDHEEALYMDAEWEVAMRPANPPVARPVPPILDQSSAYRDRLRRAESLGFIDPDDTWAL